MWEVAGEVVDLDVRDGIVYAAGPAGAVARRATDGDELVRFAAEEPRAIAAGDGVVVVRGSRLSAFDATTGADRGWFGDAGESGAAGDAAQGGTGAAAERRPAPSLRAGEAAGRVFLQRPVRQPQQHTYRAPPTPAARSRSGHAALCGR